MEKKSNEITFNDLPKVVSNLQTTVNNIERFLLENGKQQPPQPEADELLTVKKAADFLSLSVATMYGKIHRKELPVMKRSKRCYFSKFELINYLKEGRIKTYDETAREADAYLKSKKG